MLRSWPACLHIRYLHYLCVLRPIRSVYVVIGGICQVDGFMHGSRPGDIGLVSASSTWYGRIEGSSQGVDGGVRRSAGELEKFRLRENHGSARFPQQRLGEKTSFTRLVCKL